MTRLLVALLVLVVLLPSPLPAAATAQAETWPTGTPEAHDFDSVRLADVLPTIQKQVPQFHSLLMIGDGEAFLGASFDPYDGTTPHDLASVAKSVTTTLIGIAIDQGVLALGDPVLSFFPDHTIANVDARKKALTVGDLASMQTGLDCVWQPDEPTLAAMEASPDPVQFTLDLPMVAEPGTTWEYCSPGMHLLSAILTRATGMTEPDFAWQYLFGPLGMREMIWPADPQGVTHGWGDLMLRPHDAAKLGQLWLNGGEWEGRRIVSKAWVDAAVSAQATTSVENQDYGYGWWIERESEVGGQYAAEGRGGQYVVVYFRYGRCWNFRSLFTTTTTCIGTLSACPATSICQRATMPTIWHSRIVWIARSGPPTSDSCAPCRTSSHGFTCSTIPVDRYPRAEPRVCHAPCWQQGPQLVERITTTR